MVCGGSRQLDVGGVGWHGWLWLIMLGWWRATMACGWLLAPVSLFPSSVVRY